MCVYTNMYILRMCVCMFTIYMYVCMCIYIHIVYCHALNSVHQMTSIPNDEPAQSGLRCPAMLMVADKEFTIT